MKARYCFLPALSLALFLLPFSSTGQLSVSAGQPAAILAAKLAGPGITIISPVLTCASAANGTFISVSTPLTIDSGVILTSGRAVQASGPESFLASSNNGTAGDPALAALALTSTLHDACILEFNFVPKGDTVSFNYQFGSEEYNHSTCGPYNDAFAFFISGPGITGTQNMALIPGTTIPVTVNSVNSGVPGSGYSLANCTVMGPGSPFTSYFYDNTGGGQLSYKGFTKKMTALHNVTPCDTYHLKISICDAGNNLYDSGVFIEAGSLKTNSFIFNHSDPFGATISGLPNSIVKGCAPATIAVLSSIPVITNQTVHFSYGGTAVKGVDFTGPDSVTLSAGEDSAVITIAGIATIPSGTKTMEIYLSFPFSCGITDSIGLNIIDHPAASILTPDTTVCYGATFPLRVSATPGLSFSWTPTASLSAPSVMEPSATPPANTTYAFTATLPGSGCAVITDNVSVTVINTTIAMLTPDTSICLGQSAGIRLSGDPLLTYNWTPAAGLSNPAIQSPVATPAATTTYTVVATGPGFSCPSTAAVTVTVSSINTTLITADTAICKGASFAIRAMGNTGPSYSWTPADGLSDGSVLDPVASPAVTTAYTLTSSWPGSGCPAITGNLLVTVIDPTITLLTPDTIICAGQEVDIRLSANPGLLYSWSPATALSDSATGTPVATPTVTTTYSVVATDATKTCFSSASLTITVGNPFAKIITPDTAVCKGESVKLMAEGAQGLVYSWSPVDGLSDENIKDPVVFAPVTTTYTLTASQPGTPCAQTDTVTIKVVTARITDITPNTTIAYGTSIKLMSGNAMLYRWTPDDGTLNNPDISNPIATPTAPTVYVVRGIDQYGCIASDSVRIDLSYDSLFIPDAFTPNNDGLNDVFRVVNLGFYKLVNMSIFNRWGQLIYHVEDGRNNGWDGSYAGVPQDMGTYSYMIILAKPDGIQSIFKGNITLLR